MESRKIILIIAMLLSSCNFNNSDMSKQNDFYSYSDFGHYDRIPLIEPYSLISNGQGEWGFQSEKMNSSNSPFEGPVISVGIMDNTNIIVNAWRRGSNTYKIWLIVNVINDSSIEFKTKEEYMGYLKSLNIDSVKLYNDLNALYKKFDKEGVLPWAKYQTK